MNVRVAEIEAERLERILLQRVPVWDMSSGAKCVHCDGTDKHKRSCWYWQASHCIRRMRNALRP